MTGVQTCALPISNTTELDNNTTLSETDHANINELTQLGFSVDVATQAYIISGKNKEIAASVLFELMQ